MKKRFVVTWLDAKTVQKYEGTDDYDPDSGTEREKVFNSATEAATFAATIYDERADYWGCPRVGCEEIIEYTDWDGLKYHRWEEISHLNVCDYDDPSKIIFTIKEFEKTPS